MKGKLNFFPGRAHETPDIKLSFLESEFGAKDGHLFSTPTHQTPSVLDIILISTHIIIIIARSITMPTITKEDEPINGADGNAPAAHGVPVMPPSLPPVPVPVVASVPAAV